MNAYVAIGRDRPRETALLANLDDDVSTCSEDSYRILALCVLMPSGSEGEERRDVPAMAS